MNSSGVTDSRVAQVAYTLLVLESA